jgi:DNA-binding response OmpR family regulator
MPLPHLDVLVVEDHDDTAVALKKLFLMFGHSADCVSSVLDAFEFMSTITYDWIIIDLYLEGTISGLNLVDSILSINTQTRIIISTAMYLTNSEKNELIQRGVRAILDKPYNLNELLDIVSGNMII